MAVRPEAIYEIASTDAWRALINRLVERQGALAKDVMRLAAKQPANLEEIVRASGRLESITGFLNELEQVKREESD